MSRSTQASDTGTGEGATGEETLTRATIRLSWSVLLGMLAGLALQVWTAAFLGWQGEQALYVRSIYTPVGFLILAVTEGLVIATQVAAGATARTGERIRALYTLPTFLVAGGGVLAAAAVVFLVVPDRVTGILAVSADDRATVVGFIVATVASGAVGLAPMLAGAALRGVGETAISAVLAVAFAALSAGAMVAVEAVTSLGVMSVPVGGLIATAVIGVVTVVLLPRYGIARPPWVFGAEAFGWIRSVGIPVAATFLLLSSASFGYLRVLRNAGEVEVSGFGLGQTATMFFMVVALAVGSGSAIAVNIRPGEDRSALKLAGLGALLRTVLPVYVLIAAAAYFLRRPLMGLLASSDQVVDVAVHYFEWVAPTLLLFGATLAMIAYLEQVGHALAAFLLNLAYFVVILCVAFLLPQPVLSTDLARLLAIGNVGGFVTLVVATYALSRRRVPGDR